MTDDSYPKYVKPSTSPGKKEEKSIFAVNESGESIKITFVVMCALVFVLVATLLWILISKLVLTKVKAT
jgi:hypothetical protein